ncbi:MAG: PmoA family protein [Sedimentisphaerales bacterium]|nr:PmoA family protein [Sedimentisphaerales bacterium]
MNRWIFVTAVSLLVIGACSPSRLQYDARAQNGPQKVTAKLEKNHVEVIVGGKLFTRYKFDSSQKYPYFWPVCGPASNKSVTTETSEPYPHHHSLFFGCDRVNGANFWQDVNERGQIISQGPKLIRESGNRVVFTDTCLWQQPGKEPVIRDMRRITISAPSKDLRIIDFKISLKALTDIRILKTNHSLFSARVVPELSVRSGGTIINAEGNTTEKNTFGVASPWCDYWGSRGGVTEGIAILQNPDNRWYPSEWFTRDYGFFSPTPMYWLEDDQFDLAKEHILTLRYQVVVHAGDEKTAGIQNIFDQYKKTARRTSAQKAQMEFLQRHVLFGLHSNRYGF